MFAYLDQPCRSLAEVLATKGESMNHPDPAITAVAEWRHLSDLAVDTDDNYIGRSNPYSEAAIAFFADAVWKAKPSTIEGAIALMEIEDGDMEPHMQNVLAFLRDLARRAGTNR